jgi:transcriptional regulator with XRE-family HTH domain
MISPTHKKKSSEEISELHLVSVLLKEIKIVLREKKFKQDYVAREMGISQAALSSSLAGKSRIPFISLLKLLDIAGISIFDLYERTYDKLVRQQEIPEETESVLYDNPEYYVIRSLLAIPHTIEELQIKLGWPVNLIKSSVKALERLSLIKQDVNGNYRQVNPRSYIHASDDLREKFFSMIRSIILKKVIPNIEGEKRRDSSANNERLKMKYNFAAFSYLSESQLSKFAAKLGDLYYEYESLSKENKLKNFSGKDSFHFTMFTACLFDFF